MVNKLSNPRCSFILPVTLVVLVLVQLGSISRGRDLYSKAYFDFYEIYESLFVSLAKCVTGGTDEIGLNRRGVGNIGHLRFYDLIKESTRQKRNRTVIDKTSLRSSSVLFHLNIVFSLFIIFILSKVKFIIQVFFPFI